MDNKTLTPQESMALISRMIQDTRHKVAMPDLKISIMWAILSIATAIAVYLLLTTTHNPAFSLFWFAIPVIGLPTHFFMLRKARAKAKITTFVDKISSGIWRIVGLIAIFLTGLCLILNLCGYPQGWLIMLYYAFIIVGFGATAQGLILRENSYVFGGVFSIIAGFAVIGVELCQIPLLYVWVVPLYICCFLLMFVVPAFVIAKKLKNERA